jgi:hypothetical protein
MALLIHVSNRNSCPSVQASVADPHPAYHFGSVSDLYSACHFDADPDPDPTFHLDADPDPIIQIKAQNLETVLK